jgi:hypothetical protein
MAKNKLQRSEGQWNESFRGELRWGSDFFPALPQSVAASADSLVFWVGEKRRRLRFRVKGSRDGRDPAGFFPFDFAQGRNDSKSLSFPVF